MGNIMWQNKGCVLYCGKSRSIYPLQMGSSNHEYMQLAPMTFKQWSQHHKAPPTKSSIDPAYQAILDRIPGVSTCRFDENPLHGVTHHIDTTDSDPCRAKPRPLMAGSPKAVKGEARWMELDRLGVITRIKPNEPVIWSSALHLARKDGDDVRVCSDFRPLNNKTILEIEVIVQ